MTVEALVALVGAVGTVLSAWTAYALARRRYSGRIDTSDATALWAESGRLRSFLEQQLREVREEMARARIELQQKDERIDLLEAENRRLGTRVNELQMELAVIRSRQ